MRGGRQEFRIAPARRVVIACVFFVMGFAPWIDRYGIDGHWIPTTVWPWIFTMAMIAIGAAFLHFGGAVLVAFGSDELLLMDTSAMGPRAGAMARMTVAPSRKIPYRSIASVESKHSTMLGDTIALHLRDGEVISFGGQLSSRDRRAVLAELQSRTEQRI
jgi:hypothetical protein